MMTAVSSLPTPPPPEFSWLRVLSQTSWRVGRAFRRVPALEDFFSCAKYKVTSLKKNTVYCFSSGKLEKESNGFWVIVTNVIEFLSEIFQIFDFSYFFIKANKFSYKIKFSTKKNQFLYKNLWISVKFYWEFEKSRLVLCKICFTGYFFYELLHLC